MKNTPLISFASDQAATRQSTASHDVNSHSLGRVAIPDWSQAKGDAHASVK